MKRRMISLFLVLSLLPSLIVTAFSAKPPHVSDNESLLYESEENALLEEIHSLETEYSIDIVIRITDSFNGKSAEAYADDYYDFLGCGDDGLLFLLSMTQREWYISTSGKVIYALSDYGIQQLGELAVPYFSEGRYFEGFQAFLQVLPDYLDAYESGNPVDGQADYSGNYYHGSRDEVLYYNDSSPNIPLSVLIGIVVSLAAILIMRASMNTKRKQHNAAAYLQANTYHLKTQRDVFLYSNVSKVRKPQNNSSGGGGSSVHRSSSGRRHGGGGGRF